MSGNLIQVVYGVLLDASSQTAGAQSQLSELNTTVNNAVNQFNGHWDSAAKNNQFEGYYQQYSIAAQDLADWLGKLSAALSAAEAEYRSGDTTVGNIWGGA